MSMIEAEWIGSGALRAIRAEARREERIRLLDALDVEAAADERRARESNARRPALTGFGRRAAGLRQALEVLVPRGANWATDAGAGEAWAGTSNGCDGVDIYLYDPPDEPDELPVRLVVCDGGDDVMASAWLSIDDAEKVAANLAEACRRLRAARAERGQDAPEVPDGRS